MTFALRGLLALLMVASSAFHHSAPKPVAPQQPSERAWLASLAAKCVLRSESTTVNGVTLNPRAHGNRWQFEGTTWRSVSGLPGEAGSYPAAVQDAEAYKLWKRNGWLVDWKADERVCHLT